MPAQAEFEAGHFVALAIAVVSIVACLALAWWEQRDQDKDAERD
jgi:hypothetical protein